MSTGYWFVTGLMLVNGEAVSTAMARVLLDSSNVTQAPDLISPVSPRHSRANHSLVIAIVVLMVLATIALFCCCYLWERQLRLRIEATRSSTHPLQDPSVGNNLSSRPQMGSSPSVIVLLGDDVARSVAWAVPRRIPASGSPEAATQPTPTNADQSSLRKLAPN